MHKLFNRDFMNYGGLFYFYFMIWAIVLAFLPLWLKDIAGLNEAEAGFVFSSIAGGMYATMGFQSTYMFLAASVLIITMISVFTLKNDKKRKEELVPVANR